MADIENLSEGYLKLIGSAEIVGAKVVKSVMEQVNNIQRV